MSDQPGLPPPSHSASLAALRAISATLSGVFENLDELIDCSLNLITEHLQFDRALMMVAEDTRQVLTYGHITDPDPQLRAWLSTFEVPYNNTGSLFIRAFNSSEPILISHRDQLENDYLRETVRMFGTQAFAIAPLVANAKVRGIVAADNHRSQRPIPAEAVDMLFTTASLIANALNTLTLYQTLEQRVQRRTAELEEANARFEAFMRASPLVAFIKDQAQHYIYLSPRFEEILGRPNATALGLTDGDLFPAEAATEFNQTDRQVLTTGQTIEYENHAPMPNGQMRDWWVAKFPIEMRNHQRYMGSVILDITERKEAQHALQRRAEELELLRASLTELVAEIEVQPLLRKTLAQAIRLLEAQGGIVGLYDSARREVEIRASHDLDRDYFGERIQLGVGAIGQVAQTRQPLCPDIRSDWFHTDRVYTGSSPMQAMFVPLVVGQQLLGVVGVSKASTATPFTQNDVHLLELFAQQTAIIILNAQLFEAAQRRLFEAETLRQAGSIVAASLDENETIERILDQLASVVPYDSASVQVLEGQELVIIGVRGFAEPEKVLGIRFSMVDEQNPTKHIAASPRPLILYDAPKEFNNFRNPPHDHIHGWMGVPLMRGAELVGMISLDSTEPGRFTPSHIDLVSALADQIAIGLYNAKLYREALRASERRTTLYHATRAINASTDRNQICAAVHQAAGQVMSTDMVLISLTTHNPNEVEDVYLFENDQLWPVERRPANEGLVGHILKTGQTVNLTEPDIDRVLDSFGSVLVGADDPATPRSVLAVPLRLGEQKLGVLSVQSRTPRAYSTDDQELLEMLGAQAAVAFENARLYQEAVRAAERRTTLYHASRELSAATTREQVATAVHRAAEQIMPAEVIVISLYNVEQKMIDELYLFDHGQRWPARSYPSNRGLSGYVIRTRERIRVDHVDEAFLKRIEVEHFGTADASQSLLAVPLLAGDVAIGMLSVQSYRSYAYTDEDLELLEMLGGHAAVALENARLFETTQQLAHTDGLTGLLNRRRFMELANKEFERARRYDRSLSILMFDVDHFKRVNDTYGHAVGDDVLRMVAQECQHDLRQTDLIGRYGGEEFVALLPDTDLTAAREVAKRLHARIGLARPKDQPEIHVTISLGVAALQEQSSLEKLLENADQALYYAKNSGRDRVVVWAQ